MPGCVVPSVCRRAVSNEESGSGPSPEPTDAATKLMRSLSEVRLDPVWSLAGGHPGRLPAVSHQCSHAVLLMGEGHVGVC